jgi:hypothetical protein
MQVAILGISEWRGVLPKAVQFMRHGYGGVFWLSEREKLQFDGNELSCDVKKGCECGGGVGASTTTSFKLLLLDLESDDDR